MKETVLYYPYFELEKDGHISKVDHELNIKVFLLLTDKVLIPPSHLHDTSLGNIINFKQYSESFIEKGILTTSVGSNHLNLKEYFFQRRFEDNYWSKNKDYKSNEIIEIFSNVDSFRKRDRIRQSYFFYEYLNELIISKENKDIFSTKKIEIFQKELYKILDKKGYLISKNDFDDLIKNLKNKRKLNGIQYKTLSDFANSAYFFAGCIGNKSHIAHSTYFDSIAITKLDSSFEFGPILYYDPNFFLNVLIKTKIISHPDEIRNLKVEEIEILRKQKGFLKFRKLYEELSVKCQNTIDSELKSDFIKKKLSNRIETAKWVISYSNFIATAGLIVTKNEYALTIYFLTLLESYMSQYKFTQRFFNRTIDKLRVHIIDRLDPLTAFCLNLKNMIDEK